MNIDDWKSQIKRGTLEYCILLLIRKQSTYGYELISTLENYPIMAGKENTIYPLLPKGCRRENIIPSRTKGWNTYLQCLPNGTT